MKKQDYRKLTMEQKEIKNNWCLRRSELSKVGWEVDNVGYYFEKKVYISGIVDGYADDMEEDVNLELIFERVEEEIERYFHDYFGIEVYVNKVCNYVTEYVLLQLDYYEVSRRPSVLFKLLELNDNEIEQIVYELVYENIVVSEM